MILIKLFFLLVFPTGLFAADKIPRCIRPTHMGQPTLMRKYMSCLESKNTLCQKSANSRLKECAPAKPVADFRKRFPENIVDIVPSERCRILKDGSYQCLQDPIRFIVKDEPRVAPPQPDSGIKPVPGSSPGVAVPTSNSGNVAPQTNAPSSPEEAQSSENQIPGQPPPDPAAPPPPQDQD